jgi:ribokinase
MFDCIVIGDITIDTFLVINQAHVQCDVRGKDCEICFSFGAKIPIEESYQAVGGNAANVASALTQLGNEVLLVSELGDDLNGQSAYALLETRGIDMSLVTLLKGKDTRYSIIMNYLTDRTVFSHQAVRSYSLPKFPKSPWIYYTSLGKSYERMQPKLIERLKKNPEVSLAVNPGSYQLHNSIRVFKKILPHTNILFVNKEEAEIITGKVNNIEHSIAILHQMGVRTVVITDGSEGSYASDGEQIFHLPIYNGGAPISKTGAGDAYAAGFLAAYIQHEDLTTCMKWGNANGYSVTRKMGAQEGQCTEPEIGIIIRQFNKIHPTILHR